MGHVVADGTLLERIAKRDEAALEELYNRYYSRLGAFLLRLTGDTQLVGEIINDVFLVVWQKARSFRGDSQPSTWILGIAYHKALKALHVKKKTPSSNGFNGGQYELTDDSLTQNTYTDVHTSLQRLTPMHRAVLVLTYQFGYTYREISDLLGCPEGTVKTRMFHARRKLQALLEASS